MSFVAIGALRVKNDGLENVKKRIVVQTKS